MTAAGTIQQIGLWRLVEQWGDDGLEYWITNGRVDFTPEALEATDESDEDWPKGLTTRTLERLLNTYQSLLGLDYGDMDTPGYML